MARRHDSSIIIVQLGTVESEPCCAATFEIAATIIAVILALAITLALAVTVNSWLAIVFLALFVVAFVWCAAGGST